MEKSKREELEELSRPIMKWLEENYHPYAFVTITNTSAKVSVDKVFTGQIYDFLEPETSEPTDGK